MTLERRRLGRTDLTVPALGLGTWGLCEQAYGPVGEPQRQSTLSSALERGVSLFDMAPTWGADGHAERAVAQAVARRRDEVVYVTRVGAHCTGHGLEHDVSVAALRDSCERSLSRLCTDRIDVLLLHNPALEALEDDDVRHTLDTLVREGKARTWGASVGDLPSARSAIAHGAAVLCLPHHLLRPHLLWSLESELAREGVGVIASSVLAHGLLSGRWSAHKGFASNDHRARRWSRDALAARIGDTQRLQKLVRADALGLASAALRLAASEPTVSCALVGARSAAQVESAAAALDETAYPAEEIRAQLRKQAGF